MHDMEPTCPATPNGSPVSGEGSSMSTSLSERIGQFFEFFTDTTPKRFHQYLFDQKAGEQAKQRVLAWANCDESQLETAFQRLDDHLVEIMPDEFRHTVRTAVELAAIMGWREMLVDRNNFLSNDALLHKSIQHNTMPLHLLFLSGEVELVLEALDDLTIGKAIFIANDDQYSPYGLMLCQCHANVVNAVISRAPMLVDQTLKNKMILGLVNSPGFRVVHPAMLVIKLIPFIFQNVDEQFRIDESALVEKQGLPAITLLVSASIIRAFNVVPDSSLEKRQLDLSVGRSVCQMVGKWEQCFQYYSFDQIEKGITLSVKAFLTSKQLTSEEFEQAKGLRSIMDVFLLSYYAGLYSEERVAFKQALFSSAGNYQRLHPTSKLCLFGLQSDVNAFKEKLDSIERAEESAKQQFES